jgi:hypothetical protein
MIRSKRAGIVAFLVAALTGTGFAGAVEKTRTELKEKFQDGDIPTGQDFADFIDSSLNLLDDGLTLHGVGVGGSLGTALRLNSGELVGPTLTYAPFASHPPLAPLWAGEFGFLPLTYQDAGSAIHYGYLQMRMASGPLSPPPGSPGPAIFVEYLVWVTDANVPLTTSVVPEPASGAMVCCSGIGLLLLKRQRRAMVDPWQTALKTKLSFS